MSTPGLPPLVVLCYHAISDRWPSELAVTPERLRRQLELLVRRGYRGATFAAALTAARRDRTLVVTFDDAYCSTRTLAYPILAALGLPATVFVPTDFAGRPAPMSWPGIAHWAASPHAPELRCLAWDELRWLGERGWEIGSHSCSHARLTELAEPALMAELEGSRDAIERALGTRCASLAYPYGAADDRVAGCAGAAGYRAGAVLGTWPADPRPLTWPRVGVYRDDADWRFRLKLSPPIRRVHAALLGALP